jgi:integrase
MSWQLADAIKAHLIRSKEKGMKLGLGEHPEYVFTDSKCGFIALNNWRKRVFWKVLVKAKLRRIRIHDLRHTYATLRISKGDNIADVSNQLGHFSETFTMKIYYHWMPGKKKSEVDELDDADFRYREKISDENRMAT